MAQYKHPQLLFSASPETQNLSMDMERALKATQWHPLYLITGLWCAHVGAYFVSRGPAVGREAIQTLLTKEKSLLPLHFYRAEADRGAIHFKKKKKNFKVYRRKS